MTAPDPNQLTFNADQEHVGLRAVVLLLIAAWFVIGFFFFSAVFGQLGGLLAAYWLPLSCILGLIMALAVSWLAESLLKRYWPSGRRLVIDDEQLQAWLPGAVTHSHRKGEEYRREIAFHHHFRHVPSEGAQLVEIGHGSCESVF